MDLIIGIGPSIGDELNRVMTFEDNAENFDTAERAKEWNSEIVYKHPIYVRITNDDKTQIYSSKRDSKGIYPESSSTDWKPYYIQDIDGVIFSYEHVVNSPRKYQR